MLLDPLACVPFVCNCGTSIWLDIAQPCAMKIQAHEAQRLAVGDSATPWLQVACIAHAWSADASINAAQQLRQLQRAARGLASPGGAAPNSTGGG
jgi:hypothetical protein